jgi:hypothetical protein
LTGRQPIQEFSLDRYLHLRLKRCNPVLLLNGTKCSSYPAFWLPSKSFFDNARVS